MSYAIIAGIKNFTPYLAEQLTEKGYTITLIDVNPEKCRFVEERYPYRVVSGDASKHDTLRKASIMRCDLLFAMTGSDATNLAICKTAQMDFHIENTMAWINNPFNEEVFNSLGVSRCLNIVPNILAEMREPKKSSNINTYIKTTKVQSLVEKLYRKAQQLKNRRIQLGTDDAMKGLEKGYKEAAQMLEDTLNIKVFTHRD